MNSNYQITTITFLKEEATNQKWHTSYSYITPITTL